jgi:hypothetical protein
VGSSVEGYALCPCERGFERLDANTANLAVVGDNWTCDRVSAQRSMSWVKLFDGTSNFLCSGRPNTTASDLLWFQRTLQSPITTLSVAICKNQVSADEDLTLSSGDLFVRATAGFDKAMHCPTTMTTTKPATSATVVVSSDDNDNDVRWIAPTVIAAVLAVVVCCLIAALIVVARNRNVKNNSGGETTMVVRAPSSSAAPSNESTSEAQDSVQKKPAAPAPSNQNQYVKYAHELSSRQPSHSHYDDIDALTSRQSHCDRL